LDVAVSLPAVVALRFASVTLRLSLLLCYFGVYSTECARLSAFHSVLSKAHFPFFSFVYAILTAAGHSASIVGDRTIMFADRATGYLEVLL
jgi:hypothetical protein